MNPHNRRHFLKQSAVLTAALLPFSGAFGAMAKPPLQKKSLKYGMIKGDLSVLEKFQLVKSLGFDGVEMDSPSSIPQKTILEAQQATGLAIPGVVNSKHWELPLSHTDPKIRNGCIASMETALQDCQAFGGSTVLLVAGTVNQEISYQQAWDRCTEGIKKMLPMAEKTGVKIAIENVWNNFLLSPKEAAAFVDQFEHPLLGWYFDVGNVVRYGWPEHWISALGKRILKVDIKEYSRKKQVEEGIWKGFEVELLEGDCHWQEVNKALVKVGYQGWGSAEIPGGDGERLAKILKLMDEVYRQ